MTNEHTPGPWNARYRDRVTWDVYSEDFGGIVTVHDYPENARRLEPDARLIAAAPDLLAALKAVVRIANRKTVEFDAARAAIARAEGKAK